jgi:ELWxxDGT repeat protein
LVTIDRVAFFAAVGGPPGRVLWWTAGPGGGTTLVKDINPGEGAIVRFTYPGDADLDRDVVGVDSAKWAINFTGSGVSTSKLWTEGDWDYDGDVDGVDSARWSTNYTGSGANLIP